MKQINKYIFVYLLIFIQVCLSQDYPDEIVFYSNGSVFSALITVEGNPMILWTFDDNTTNSTINPIKDYGSEFIRKNRLKVTPWSALKGINIGYDGSDGGSDSITYLASQNVSNVEHLNLVAPYLELWCSSYNPLDSLNFDDFINLKIIECYECKAIKNVSLKNTPNLRRLCLENNNLMTLDLSECTGLEDLRAAINNYKDIKFSNSTEELWHICVRDNPQIENSLLFSHLEVFPTISELWIWNSNQTGAFNLHKTIADDISIVAHTNSYSTLDLSGALQKDNTWAQVYFQNNKLESVNVSGCKQIYKLDLSNNKLLPDSVDKVLRQIDELGELKYTDYRFVDLRKNALPTSMGLSYKANLEKKGWTIYVETGGKIIVSGGDITISNGDQTPSKSDLTDFDSIRVGSGGKINTFIIKNTGTTALHIFGNLNIDGKDASDFKIISQPDSVIQVGDSTYFQISFDPSNLGLLTATVSISNDNWDNNPFIFDIQGTGVALTNMSLESGITDNFELSQNFPNPFNPITKIHYSVPLESKVTISVYSITGELLAELVNEYKTPGNYSVNFDGSKLASGMYIYKMTARNFVKTYKMMPLK